MHTRWLHIALAVLILAQPMASPMVWAAVPGSDTLPATDELPTENGRMSGCHDAESAAGDMAMPAVDMSRVPALDCCDTAECLGCGIDCGAASPAINQAAAPGTIPGHGTYGTAASYAAPIYSPGSLFKPPRTS